MHVVHAAYEHPLQVDRLMYICRATAKMISLTLAIIVVLANCIRYCGTIDTILPTGNIVSMVEHK